ncbi:hypothetical protein ACFV4N_08395 [Actinosynnema sp. NPDC059797]
MNDFELIPCPDCRGSGQLWDENAYIDCETCKTRGSIWTDPDATEGRTEDCEFCGGSGLNSDGTDDCAVCEGDGVIDVWGTAPGVEEDEDNFDDGGDWS